MRQHNVIGRAAARAAGFQQRGMEPAAMLIRALEIEHLIRAAVALAFDSREAGKMRRVLEREGMRRAGVEPHVENIVDLLVIGGLVVGREETLRRAFLVPGVGALLLEGFHDASVHALVDENLVAALLHEDGDGHAPGALARDHPIGTIGDHAADAILARRGHPLRARDFVERDIAQRRRVSTSPLISCRPRPLILRSPRLEGWAAVRPLALRDGASRLLGVRARMRECLVERDEPLRRVAEDDRLLRPPAVRILMLQPPARDEIARRDKRLDHRVIGVALVALLGKHALAGKAGRLVGVEAVGVDRIGDARVDAALGEHAPARHPYVEVLAAMSGRRVDEARSRVVGDVVAVEQRHREIIAEMCERMRGDEAGELLRRHVAQTLESFHLGGFEHIFGELVGEHIGRADFRPIILGRRGHAIEAISNLVRIRDRAIARQRPGSRRPERR